MLHGWTAKLAFRLRCFLYVHYWIMASALRHTCVLPVGEMSAGQVCLACSCLCTCTSCVVYVHCVHGNRVCDENGAAKMPMHTAEVHTYFILLVV
jgi:hypothetical protein